MMLADSSRQTGARPPTTSGSIAVSPPDSEEPWDASPTPAAAKHTRHSRPAPHLEVSQPLLRAREGGAVRDVVHNDARGGVAKEGARHGPVHLFARRVPDLHADERPVLHPAARRNTPRNTRDAAPHGLALAQVGYRTEERLADRPRGVVAPHRATRAAADCGAAAGTHLTSLDANAAPIVVFMLSVNWSFVNLTTTLDFPVALSPIITICTVDTKARVQNSRGFSPVMRPPRQGPHHAAQVPALGDARHMWAAAPSIVISIPSARGSEAYLESHVLPRSGIPIYVHLQRGGRRAGLAAATTHLELLAAVLLSARNGIAACVADQARGDGLKSRAVMFVAAITQV